MPYIISNYPHITEWNMTCIQFSWAMSMGEGPTCLSQRMKIWVYKFEETKNHENQRSEDWKSEDG